MNPSRNGPSLEVVGHMSLSPPDAWFFARARTGHTLDSEVHRVSVPNRPLAQRMAEAPVEGREQVWNGPLTTLSEAEADAWIEAVAAVNPDGPPPEDDSWGPPLAFELPPVEPFPMEVFPSPVAHLIRHGARSLGCPFDFLAMAVLPVAGAAIGRSVSLRLKNGYFASASIYAACVALPGDGKSPAVSAVARPMRQIDETHFAKWKEERCAFEALNEAYESASRTARKSRLRSKGADGLDREGYAPDPPAVPAKPVPPIPKRCMVADITMEAMDSVMEQNPRGLLQVLDEASSLMTSMNQYRGGKGSDRQWYMSVWSGEPRTVDRKGHADNIPIRVPHPFLGFISVIITDMIDTFCDEKGRHDGFIDRFLFTYPDPTPKTGWREEGIPDDAAAAWSEIVHRLHALPMRVEDLRFLPNVVHLSPEGKTVWRQMIDAHHAEQNNAGFPPSLSGPWAKLEQYAGRIVLVLHMLELAADPAWDMGVIPDVSGQTVRNAARLLTYLKSHTRRVHAAMKARARGEEGNEDVQCILKWILRHRPESFTRRDLTRDLSATFSKRSKALEQALNWLVKHGCIRRQPEPERPKGSRGRTPSATYLVNPHLITSQNCQNHQPIPASVAKRDDEDDFGNSALELTCLTGEEDGDDLPF